MDNDIRCKWHFSKICILGFGGEINISLTSNLYSNRCDILIKIIQHFKFYFSSPSVNFLFPLVLLGMLWVQKKSQGFRRKCISALLIKFASLLEDPLKLWNWKLATEDRELSRRKLLSKLQGMIIIELS